ncbi:Co2+/Mg2+ efflux protein ApaG [Glaciecola sp. KUL10]|jgi:ApaG protein|uniref:Co2+/Mg2+ efflux protein ApaG n=1 Tax=Glaciecola sp. (strain KUL10) TaxID=2161813 RepID=UPI000D7853BE|nr:Co2+/Mg2+ efflux protein ApaG [Glaciecola sp. KUL10]GBL06111.1 ApaG protein [Glaciecola sp. KUL10]
MLEDIKIKVETKFLGRQEQKDAEPAFVFSYKVTIQNLGNQRVQLLRRYWLVTNGDGEKVEVAGDGVVGKQPLIEPNQSFDYTSASMLKTPVGTMEGYYEFELFDGSTKRAAIPIFSLAIPNSLH